MKKDKILKSKEPEKTVTIALVGTKPGVGVTHTGILTAEYLKEKMGARTAFVEVNHHGHMEQMERIVYGYSSPVFSFHGIDYYKNMGNDSLSKLFKQSYNYLILDFGTQKKKEEEALKQCDRKILVGSLNMWEWQEYIKGAKHFEDFLTEKDSRYLVSFGEQKVISKMEKTLQKKIYVLGNQPLNEPLSQRAEQFFQTLL